MLTIAPLVEIELGLFDDAAEKFRFAIQRDGKVKSLFAYGLSSCLLSMAKRDLQDNKFGSAFRHLEEALLYCERAEIRSACFHKLVGDIHSIGVALPPRVFVSHSTDSDVDSGDRGEWIRVQVEFVRKAEKAYRAAEELTEGTSPEESDILRACIVSDLASAILAQGQLISFWKGQGVLVELSEARSKFELAATEFRRSLKLNPLYAHAWCGLGCAVASSDPLLAQHAFCRSLELDNLSPESYSNLAFLYTEKEVLDRSTSVSDALTQVADSPMMWINRAIIIRKQLSTDMRDAESLIKNTEMAAAAYRAALQISSLPVAVIGLALTCRSSRNVDPSRREESSCLLSEYDDSVGGVDIIARAYLGTSWMEEGARSNTQENNALVERGMKLISSSIDDFSDRHARKADEVSMVSRQIEQFDALLQLKSSSDAPIHRVQEIDQGKSLSVTQRILLEPDRGELWLSLAKEIMLQADTCSSHRHIAHDALRTARKASTILIEKLGNPLLGSDPVDASDVTEALTLQHWLEQGQAADVQSASGSDEETLSLPTQARATVNTQLAFLLNPDNALAREVVCGSLA